MGIEFIEQHISIDDDAERGVQVGVRIGKTMDEETCVREVVTKLSTVAGICAASQSLSVMLATYRCLRQHYGAIEQEMNTAMKDPRIPPDVAKRLRQEMKR